MKRFAIVFGVLSALLGNSAQSDEIRPGYLELRQATPDTYSLLFKILRWAMTSDWRSTSTCPKGRTT